MHRPETCNFARGKLLGGSSAVNYLAWTRASKVEYDTWESFAAGNGWNWNGLLPFFEKVSSIFPNQVDPFPGVPTGDGEATAVNNTGYGPILVIRLAALVFIADYWLDNLDIFECILSRSCACIRGNVKRHRCQDQSTTGRFSITNFILFIWLRRTVNLKFNSETTGITNCLSNINRIKGIRSYSASGYFCRSALQPNFHVFTNAQVCSIFVCSHDFFKTWPRQQRSY